MTLKTSLAAKPTNRSVLEKLGHGDDHTDKKKAAAEKAEKAEKAAKMAEKAEKPVESVKDKERKDKKRDKDKKSAADRREELLKQLKAVENAIAKKRTRISTNN